MVANAALLGLLIGAMAKEPSVTLVPRVALKVMFLVASGTGFSLGLLWLQALRSGAEWIEHWLVLLKELEPAAFGDQILFRGVPGGRNRLAAKQAAMLFILLWGALLLYTIWLVFVGR
jgi:hypothetical protein